MTLKIRIPEPVLALVGVAADPPTPDWQVHQQAVDFSEKNGYNQCAIVVKKSETFHHSMEKYGVVVQLCRTMGYPAPDEPQPLLVRWLATNRESRESPHNLILVNPAPAWSSICRAVASTVRELKV